MAITRLLPALLAYTARLRFPTLAMLTGALFLFDLLIPDAIPVADEVLLGLATAMFAAWRKEKDGDGDGGGKADGR